MQEKIIIADFGSQYTQLIARKVRELGVYAEIVPYTKLTPDFIDKENPAGIILSGGPASVIREGSPSIDPTVFKKAKRAPILGICYGMQLMNKLCGGEVGPSIKREYGRQKVEVKKKGNLLKGFKSKTEVWMSHGDVIRKPAKGFAVLANSDNHIASIENQSSKLFGVQFHPEVHHTREGKTVLKNFLGICGCKADWTMKAYIEQKTREIRDQVQDSRVIVAVSGGVDSSVAATLVSKAIGDNLICIFIDNGFLRKNEASEVMKFLKPRLSNLEHVDASTEFILNLKGITDPEKKRKIIGALFIEVLERKAREYRVSHLVQGTIYPDVIESVSAFGSPTSKIKSHHNVGGLPENMNVTIVEPLKYLFKDEVRVLGRELNLPKEILSRHPFPGPGLSVRCPGEISEDKLRIIREADAIFIDELRKNKLYDKIWQAYAAILPIKTTGVMGDERTYEYIALLRAVNSVDGMTANASNISNKILTRISDRIINQVKGVNRVVYDVSSKPPATIELE
ncbi:glutamine-hydrolyzing GMP synthase [Elusimicrobiota bacterium]